MVQLTHSPDPQHLGAGAGTAAAQSAVPRQYADPDGIGYVNTAPVPATGATAGTPGTFTPAGGYVLTFANMTGIVASPATAWTVGQRVVCSNGDEAYWNGTAWATGRAPVV